MFDFFRKKDAVCEVEMYAIGKGKVIPLADVPDQTFATGLLGEGIGFQIENDVIYAPCDGKVTLLADTNHAIGMKLKNNAEILIHVGMDTVNLNGMGLHPLVSCNDSVKRGIPLMKIDRSFMEEKGINLTTPVILTNGEDYILKIEKENEMAEKNDCVIRIIKR